MALTFSVCICSFFTISLAWARPYNNDSYHITSIQVFLYVCASIRLEKNWKWKISFWNLWWHLHSVCFVRLAVQNLIMFILGSSNNEKSSKSLCMSSWNWPVIDIFHCWRTDCVRSTTESSHQTLILLIPEQGQPKETEYFTNNKWLRLLNTA